MKILKALGLVTGTVAAISLGTGTANAATGSYLVNYHTQLCAGVGNKPGNGAPVIQWDCNQPAADMRWNYEPTTDSNGAQAWFIKNEWSGKCMGVQSSLTNGTGVIQYTCNHASDEKWWWTTPNNGVSAGVWRNVYSGLCLAVGSNPTKGKQLIQYSCNGANDEFWFSRS
ncbi:RICIN domain-containing protein (plasmid) [Streptomyces xanthophaeus]|uniref:RICIN domain-containing protein n=1 Tax=Streptomyces xanthophaeus TaxID=67385 RepID=UPI0039901CCE